MRSGNKIRQCKLYEDDIVSFPKEVYLGIYPLGLQIIRTFKPKTVNTSLIAQKMLVISTIKFRLLLTLQQYVTVP